MLATPPPNNAPDEYCNPRKNSGRAFPQLPHVFGIFVKTPAICRHASNGTVNGFKVRLGSLPDLFRRQGIDRIERGHLDPAIVCLGTKRADSAGYIQDFFSA